MLFYTLEIKFCQFGFSSYFCIRFQEWNHEALCSFLLVETWETSNNNARYGIMVLRDKRGLYVSISTLLGQFSRPPQEDVVYGTTLLLFNAQRGAGERKKLCPTREWAGNLPAVWTVRWIKTYCIKENNNAKNNQITSKVNITEVEMLAKKKYWYSRKGYSFHGKISYVSINNRW